tara:strand:+ start:3985 stop:5298 length:1314 start_codon:yes stop_codon:yes gene_type:complete
MSVLCVESGITYATGVAAVAAEGGANRSMRVSGSVSFATSVNPSQYNLGIVIFANPGEETQDDGDINIGAQMTGSFACAAPNSEIRDLRTNNLNLTSAANATTDRLITDGLGSDGVLYNDTVNIGNHIVHNADDSFISSATRPNSNIRNITSVGANRFGIANGKVNDSVDVNSGNQGYFGEMPGSGNLWEHDGSGTNTITESPVTDVFVDYAAGKYGILSTSGPGAAGAGAFIQSAPPAGITIEGQTPDYSLSAVVGSVFLNGNIDVVGETVNYNFNSVNGGVDLVGEILVVGQTPGENYSPVSGSVSVVGEISVIGQVANYSLSTVSGDVSFVGQLLIDGQSPNYLLNPVDGNVRLTSGIVIFGNTPSYSYTAISGTVLTMGEVLVDGQTPNYVLSAINGIISAGSQDIGDININYVKDDTVVNYVLDTITINYEE